MIIWHRNRRGRGGTTPRCRSRNIANNTFSEGWLQKSNEFAGLRTAPASHHAKNTANTTFSCGMLQNAGFGTIPCGGGGGVVANREPGSYILKKVNFCLPKAVPRKLSPGGSGSLVFHPILSNGLCSFQAISYHMEKVMVFWRCLFVSFVESNVPNLLQTCGSCVFECISYLEFPQVQISKKVRPNLKAPNLQKNSQNS